MKHFMRIICCAGLLVGSFGTTQAASTFIFQPVDQTVNFFNVLGGSNTDLELAMFDENDTGFAGPWLDININGDVASFSPTIGQNVDYTVTNNNANTLTLLGSDRFILALRDLIGPDMFLWTEANSVTCDSNTDSCTASWSIGTTELVVDVKLSAVPVPAAVWLFTSGLFGMTLFRRRRR